MYHPTTRVLTVLELLQAHGRLSGAELAARLEVDRRTVRRYITMLEDLGIPIEAERGPYGGYRLRPGFKLPPLMLTNDEALALAFSLAAAEQRHVPAAAHALAGVRAKLERVLPATLRSEVQALRSVVLFGADGAPPPPAADLVVTLSLAAAQRQRVRLRYQSWSAETERDVDPYGVVQHYGRWYVAGWCHLRAAPRVFRVDRVVAAEPTGATFARPAGVDPLALVRDTLAAVPWGWRVEVLLATTSDELRGRLDEWSAQLTPVAGGVMLQLLTDNLDWLARRLLLLGCRFVVHTPPELRDALRDIAREAAELAELTPAS